MGRHKPRRRHSHRSGRMSVPYPQFSIVHPKCITRSRAMSVLWIDVPDKPGSQSDRAFIERNAIALLSNQFARIDGASESWLGRFSPRREIRDSGLWNLKYVADVCDPTFLEKLESFVTLTCEGGPRLTLMRTAMVKRHTTPVGGFCGLPLARCERRRHAGSCPDFMAVCRCRAHGAAPHPSCGALAVAVTSAEAPQGMAIGGLATALSPPPGLRHVVAERVRGASSCEARRRGRPRPRCEDQRRLARRRRGRPRTAPGSGRSADGRMGGHGRRVARMPARAGQADPTGGP